MPFLDAALKVIRVLSGLVWLAVGVVTLWGTWVTFRELGPYVKTLTGIVNSAGPRGLAPSLPSGLSPEQLQQFLGPRGGTEP